MSRQLGTDTHQRLAAILAADVAGYSRLMAADERRTMEALDAARDVFRTQIELHEGRVVDMAGDSVLAVFEAAAGAVSAALEVQQRLEALAAGVPADRSMRFRIGVHLGDVIEKADGTVYGEGVNIAARLEGLALPGGVTVSDAVQGAVRNRVSATFEDLGEQQVKNIADPVRAYRVFASASHRAPENRRWRVSIKALASSRGPTIAAALVLTAVLAAATWHWSARTRDAKGIPVTMSIAIGSITSPKEDDPTVQAGQTLARTLATGLGALERDVRVLTLSGATKSNDTRELARAAGARYVLEGDLHPRLPRRALSLRLVETQSGLLTWSALFDLPLIAGSTEEHVSIRNAIGQVALAVTNAEISRVFARPVSELDTMELVVRANAVLDRDRSIAGSKEARKMLDEALRIEPTLVPALRAVLLQIDRQNDVDPHPDHDRYVRETDQYSALAVTLDPNDSNAWGWRAVALLVLGRWNASLEASEREIKLNPYAAEPYMYRAWLLNMMGRPSDALPLTERALTLSPSNPGPILRYQCEAHLLLGATNKAISSCERATGLVPNDFLPHSFLAAAYANAGDIQQAQAALNAMLKTVPGYTMAQLRAKRYSDHPDYQSLAEKHWYNGLRKAGLPDHD